MGFRCRWVATKGADVKAVADRLGFAVEDTLHEPAYDPGLYAARLPSGWVVVIGDGWDFMDQIRPEDALDLSKEGEGIFFYCDDTPMCAELTAYARGREAWSLRYDGSNGVGTPEVDGEPPAALSAALRAAEDDQARAGGKNAGVDHLYDVAPRVGLAWVGFRHDQTLSSGDVHTILQLRPR